MKNIYKISMKAFYAYCLFRFLEADAQLTVMSTGNYTVGDIF